MTVLHSLAKENNSPLYYHKDKSAITKSALRAKLRNGAGYKKFNKESKYKKIKPKKEELKYFGPESLTNNYLNTEKQQDNPIKEMEELFYVTKILLSMQDKPICEDETNLSGENSGYVSDSEEVIVVD